MVLVLCSLSTNCIFIVTLQSSILSVKWVARRRRIPMPPRGHSVPTSSSLEIRGRRLPENPGLKITGVAKVLGQMWKEMDESEKAPYVKKAEIAKKKHADEMAAYKKKAS